MLLPLDDGTKSTLSRIESFVKSNVVSQTYKPLWLKDAMYVNISKWCRFETVHFNGTRTLLPQGTVLGKGTYSVTLQVSHVYVGPHKGGETFSLSLHITNLAFKPEEDIMDFIESFDNHCLVGVQNVVELFILCIFLDIPSKFVQSIRLTAT